jgi:hypothetical protein
MRQGDTVICIDNKPSYIMKDVPLTLTIGKSYIVQLKAATRDTETIRVLYTIRVLDDENMFKDFRADRFITQSEWLQRQRHNKLNELGI